MKYSDIEAKGWLERKKTPTRRLIASLAAVALLAGGEQSASGYSMPHDTVVAGIVQSEPQEVAFEAAPNLDELAQQWQEIIATRPGNIDVAIMDLNTGQTTQARNTEQRFYSASIVKLSILVELLRRYEEQGLSVAECETEYGANLAHCAQLDIATPMITQSDNTAATTLFNAVGGAGEGGLEELYTRIGASDTEVSASWGVTLTTAADQLKVLQAAITPGYVLGEEYVAYARKLMASVDTSQQWGAGDGIPRADVSLGVKNGWIPDLIATFNTDGEITSHDGKVHYIISILTNGGQSEAGNVDNGSQTELEAKKTMAILNGAAYTLLLT